MLIHSAIALLCVSGAEPNFGLAKLGELGELRNLRVRAKTGRAAKNSPPDAIDAIPHRNGS